MLEADVSAEVMQSLRGDQNILAFKIRDQSTIGIPDIIATGYDHSTWLETKNLKRGMKLWQFINKEKYGALQLHHMRRLSKHGRAWYLVYRNGGVEIWHPEYVWVDFHKKQEREVYPVINFASPTILWGLLRNCPPLRFTQKIYQIANIIVRMEERVPYEDILRHVERVSSENRNDGGEPGAAGGDSSAQEASHPRGVVRDSAGYPRRTEP